MKLATFKVERVIGNHPVTLYSTVIQVAHKHYLIDRGYEETFDEFVAALHSLGLSVKDLHAIIISHDDIDHLGGLHLFKQQHEDLLIYCSEVEAPSVSGKIKSERLEQAESTLAYLPEAQKDWALDFIQQLKRIQRLEVDQLLRDNDSIEQGLIVIHTPGHTRGHISLYIPGEATVIANDAVVIEGDELNIANPSYTLDLPQALKSVERIRDLHPDTLICYHGGIMKGNIYEKLNALLLKFKKPAFTS